MIDPGELRAALTDVGLEDWHEDLLALTESRLSPSGHGDFTRWRECLDAAATSTSAESLKTALLGLSPWRKGPFDVGDVHIDAEWPQPQQHT